MLCDPIYTSGNRATGMICRHGHAPTTDAIARAGKHEK